MNENDLLSPQEAGEEVKTSPATLASWRCLGRGPKYVKLGGKVFYRRTDLEDFVTSRVVDPAAIAR